MILEAPRVALEIKGGPKTLQKNLIRHHLGVPGRERGGPKLFKGPHGQGHRKKMRFVIEILTRKRRFSRGQNVDFIFVFPIESCCWALSEGMGKVM